MAITLSGLAKTWCLDIDGVIFRHNSHLQGEDELLPGVSRFFLSLPPEDVVILLSARAEEYRHVTEKSLTRHGLRYDHLLLGLPTGERILMNDVKPSGLLTAHALNVNRDEGLTHIHINYDDR